MSLYANKIIAILFKTFSSEMYVEFILILEIQRKSVVHSLVNLMRSVNLLKGKGFIFYQFIQFIKLPKFSFSEHLQQVVIKIDFNEVS